MTTPDIDHEAEAAQLAAVEAVTPRCTHCEHLAHPDRQCRVVRVNGRVKTQCPCQSYVSTLERK